MTINNQHASVECPVGKLLVTGATGLLGSTLVPYLRSCRYDVVTHARSAKADFRFDLTDALETREHFERIRPSVIINLVGLTSVEACEEQLKSAYLANTRTVENLANAVSLSKTSCHLVQVSTDQLYDGAGEHAEGDVTITNVYALTKYAGELAAHRVRSTILRTNFVGRSRAPHRESLTDWVYNSMTSGKNVQVLDDVHFSPLSMSTLAEMIELVVRKRPVGVYNVGSREGMSKAEFDFRFAEQANVPTHSMARILTAEASFLRAYRPKDMRMDSSKFERVLGVKMPRLIEQIQQVAKEYDERY